MAFKMKRGNIGKHVSDNMGSPYPKSSPNKIIGMGIMKFLKGKDGTRLGGKRTIRGAGGKRNLFGRGGTWKVDTKSLIDWDYTWQGIKDFFGGIGGGKGKKINLNIEGKPRRLPTTLAKTNIGQGGSRYIDDKWKKFKSGLDNIKPDVNA